MLTGHLGSLLTCVLKNSAGVPLGFWVAGHAP